MADPQHQEIEGGEAMNILINNKQNSNVHYLPAVKQEVR